MPVSINGNGSVVGVTSVTGAGMDLIATATVTAASTITFNNVFSANYRRYFLLASGTSSGSLGVGWLARLRVSGTDNVTSVYYYGGAYVTNVAGPSRDYGVTTQWPLGTANNISFSSTTQIIDPFLSAPTSYLSQYQGAGTGDVYMGNYSGFFYNPTSFTGLTIYPTSGTITAQAAIYGYGG